MKNNKRQRLFSLVKDIVQTYFQKLSDIQQLAKLEARLAGRSLISLIIAIIIIGFLVGSAWLSLLLMLFIFLFSFLHFSLLLAAFVVVILNLLCLAFACWWLIRAKKNLFFKATRR